MNWKNGRDRPSGPIVTFLAAAIACVALFVAAWTIGTFFGVAQAGARWALQQLGF